jgi:hypothetical protein
MPRNLSRRISHNLFKPGQDTLLSTRQMLVVIALAAGVALLLGIVPWLSWLAYPFRLLLTIVHELGHGLMAMATGGRFERFIIQSNGAGVAFTAGGWRLLVVPAGYVGTVLFGAALIWFGHSQRWARRVLGIVGGILVVCALLYARTLLTFSVTLLFGLFWLWVARRASTGWTVFLLHFLALEAALTSIGDLLGLIGLSANFFAQPHNDARSMQQMTLIPAVFWAVGWTSLATLLLGGATWSRWLRRVHR